MRERWHSIPGYEGLYEASDRGRVRGIKRRRVLALVKGRRGYLHVNLYRDGRAKNKLVHRLVLASFAGPIRLGWEVNHKDGDKTNNELSNLEQMTGEQNREHARAQGLFKPRLGEDNKSSKLTEAQVREIRRLRKERMPVQEIAWRFRVSQGAVYSILKRKTWRHVE